MRYQNKTFVLTGAASGIGRAMTLELHRRGARFVACDINAGGLDELARELRFDPARHLTLAHDVRSAEGWQAVFARAEDAFGRVEVMLNIAGYLKPGYSHRLDPADIDRHLDVNAKGVMLGTHYAARHMVARGGGHIVNIASLAGVAPIPGLCLYSASKFAVRGFTLAAAAELKPHNVLVTCVCPDAVQSPMLDLQVGYEEASLTFSGPRALTPEEVVSAVLDDALPNGRAEILLPRSRGALARLASAVPAAAQVLEPVLRRQGNKKRTARNG